MPSFSINIIRVGSDQFTAANENEIGNAITDARNIFAQVGYTIDGVAHYAIPTAQARGREVINDNDEAVALTDEWTVPNHAVDVFVVRSYLGTVAGQSPVGGPCDKDAKGMDGTVVELITGFTGEIMAHELGHYFGLRHRDNDPNNLMFPSSPNGRRLDDTQKFTMNCHCFVSGGICIG